MPSRGCEPARGVFDPRRRESREERLAERRTQGSASARHAEPASRAEEVPRADRDEGQQGAHRGHSGAMGGLTLDTGALIALERQRKRIREVVAWRGAATRSLPT